MAAVQVNWLALGLAFVRFRPKTSAVIAFELGLLAAQALKASRQRKIPEKLIELAPSLGDLGGFIDRRRRAKTSPPKRAKRPAAKRTPRLKKASPAAPSRPAQNP
jgi:hypothetical protein